MAFGSWEELDEAMPGGFPIEHEEGHPESAAALDILTTAAANHPDPPVQHIHAPSDDPKTNAWMSKLLPASTIQDIESYYHMGNYVIDRKTGEKTFEQMSIYVRLGMHFLYYGTLQEKFLHWKKTRDLLKFQSEKMGLMYDSPSSKNHIVPFINSFGLQDSMAEMVRPDPASYENFNEFFAREIKESARPIDEPDNDLVTSSPADCRLTAFPTIDLATKYWIKGHGFTLAKLLGDEALAAEMEGGSLVIARLAPQDYHRWHAPVSGTVQSVNLIPGTYLTVNPQAVNAMGTMNVFTENKRSVMTVTRKSTGSKIAIVAVGAMLVGSIFYVDGMEERGAEMKRGECLGGFKYGGSTVIVIYPKGETELDEDLVGNSVGKDCETLVQVGWRVGVKKL